MFPTWIIEQVNALLLPASILNRNNICFFFLRRGGGKFRLCGGQEKLRYTSVCKPSGHIVGHASKPRCIAFPINQCPLMVAKLLPWWLLVVCVRCCRFSLMHRLLWSEKDSYYTALYRTLYSFSDSLFTLSWSCLLSFKKYIYLSLGCWRNKSVSWSERAGSLSHSLSHPLTHPEGQWFPN